MHSFSVWDEKTRQNSGFPQPNKDFLLNWNGLARRFCPLFLIFPELGSVSLQTGKPLPQLEIGL